jgi:hypothetical protein
MLAGGMFWYWHALPKHTPTKKNARVAEATGRSPVKKSLPAHAPASSSTANNSAANKYRAVSIQCPAEGCAAAKALDKKRFLTREAPVLPLKDCDQATCHCSYAHHADRRSVDDDRRSIHSLQTELYTRTAGQERRTRRGRRKEDHS